MAKMSKKPFSSAHVQYLLKLSRVSNRSHCQFSLCTRDVPDTRFWCWLVGYPAVFYYPVPDLDEMLNGARYRNRIFYCRYNIIRSWMSKNLFSPRSFVSTTWCSNKHILCITEIITHCSLYASYTACIISMQSNGAAITLSASGSGQICWQISGNIWFHLDFKNLNPVYPYFVTLYIHIIYIIYKNMYLLNSAFFKHGVW